MKSSFRIYFLLISLGNSHRNVCLCTKTNKFNLQSNFQVTLDIKLGQYLYHPKNLQRKFSVTPIESRYASFSYFTQITVFTKHIDIALTQHKRTMMVDS